MGDTQTSSSFKKSVTKKKKKGYLKGSILVLSNLNILSLLSLLVILLVVFLQITNIMLIWEINMKTKN